MSESGLDIGNNSLNSNYVYTMEPLLPPKDEVLNYLNNEGPEPMVKAKVCIKGINISTQVS